MQGIIVEPTNVRTTVAIVAAVVLREHEVNLSKEEREHLEQVVLEYAKSGKADV